jgi:hypothetical protein
MTNLISAKTYGIASTIPQTLKKIMILKKHPLRRRTQMRVGLITTKNREMRRLNPKRLIQWKKS